jgi:hypothetical protein
MSGKKKSLIYQFYSEKINSQYICSLCKCNAKSKEIKVAVSLIIFFHFAKFFIMKFINSLNTMNF